MPKFSDIPQFTQPANYSVNISWDYLPICLDNWTNDAEPGEGLNLNPDFQRGHVWTKKQQIAYVEFKLRGGTGSDVILFNAPNWMRSGGGVHSYKNFVLVDGKQRIQAILDFMDNKIPVFGHPIDKYEDKFDRMDHNFLFKVNNLKSRADVLRWYLEINTGGVVHTSEEITKVRNLLDKELENG